MSTPENLINAKTAGFVGRDYIFEAVADFVANNDRGVVVLEGDPGAGKSSILAEYIRRTHCIGHFNLRAQGINSTRDFVRSISDQMTRLYGGPSASTADGDGETVKQLVNQLRTRLRNDLPMIVAIDALDEVDAGSTGTNPLFLPSVIGPGVYFVLTTRRNESPLRFDGPFQKIDLRDYRDETLADVDLYLRNRFDEPRIARRIEQSRVSPTDFVRRLTEMSEGNFMYLQYTLIDIGSSREFDLDRFLRVLPQGLENYYREHWQRMGMATDTDPTVNAWILYVLCEASKPLPAWVVSSALRPVTAEASPALVQQRFDQWSQFLHTDMSVSPANYSIYHASFRDFLHRHDVVANAGVDLRGVAQVIADLMWEHEFGEDEDD
jgi:hypothetical protein